MPVLLAWLFALAAPAAANAEANGLTAPVAAVTGAVNKTLESVVPDLPESAAAVPLPTVQAGPVTIAPTRATPDPVAVEPPAAAPAPSYDADPSYYEAAPADPEPSAGEPQAAAPGIAEPVELAVTDARSAVSDSTAHSGRRASTPASREDQTPPAGASAAGFGEAVGEPLAVSPEGAAEGGTRAAGPIALSDWIGPGPLLSSTLVYLLLVLTGAMIVVTMRRELGLHRWMKWRL